MNKIVIGILLGCAAGVLDVLPMIAQKLPWDANISAFCMWVAAGFLIATSSLQMNGALKGLLVSFLMVIPVLVLVAWKEPKSIIPIVIMTTILGSSLGLAIEKLAK